MSSDLPTPSALELRVAMDRLGGVVYPCLVCGGRGRSDAFGPECKHCLGLGEEPLPELRRAAYGDTA